jgi:predicted DNA-binding transcriptional regulator AlpA
VGSGMTIERRLLSREQAAAYCGYTPDHFSRKVSAGHLPAHIVGMKRWDKRAIDAAIDKKSGLSSAPSIEDAFDAWEREYEADKAKRLGEGKEAPGRRKAK